MKEDCDRRENYGDDVIVREIVSKAVFNFFSILKWFLLLIDLYINFTGGVESVSKVIRDCYLEVDCWSKCICNSGIGKFFVLRITQPLWLVWIILKKRFLKIRVKTLKFWNKRGRGKIVKIVLKKFKYE